MIGSVGLYLLKDWIPLLQWFVKGAIGSFRNVYCIVGERLRLYYFQTWQVLKTCQVWWYVICFDWPLICARIINLGKRSIHEKAAKWVCPGGWAIVGFIKEFVIRSFVSEYQLIRGVITLSLRSCFSDCKPWACLCGAYIIYRFVLRDVTSVARCF